MADKNFPGRSALEALFGAIKSALSSKQNQTLSTTIAGSSTVEGALQALEQSYSGLDYSELDNKPQINGVELSGNKTASELGIAIPTNLSDLNDDSTHRLVTDTEKSTWNGKADTADITNAINALDVSSVGGTGKYISEISEADGKISATAETMDDVPTENSNAPVKSGGIKTAIDDSVSLKTATGNPITLTDAANANAEKLLMTIEPIQSGSGDPSPINVRPISGLTEGKVVACGKNLLVGQPSFDGYRSLSTYMRGEDYEGCEVWYKSNSWAGLTTDCHVKEGVYTFSAYVKTDGNINAYIYLDADGSDAVLTPNQTQISVTTNWTRVSVTFTVTKGGLIRPRIEKSAGSGNIYLSRYQLELGTIATEFEPYTAATATISFGQTVYGGSVNFKTGEVTVTHGIITLDGSNDEGWSFTNRFETAVGLCSNVNESSDSHISNMLTCAANNNASRCADTENVFAIYANGKIYASYNIASSVSDLQAKLLETPLTVCYELATPTTLTLTPAELELLKGNNTITANGAEISIEYYPDNAIGALAERVDNKADITYVDNAINNQVDSKHYKLYSQDFTNVDISAAWGGWYITAGSVLSISYSDLGLTEPPAAVFLSVETQNNAFMIMQTEFTESEVNFHLVRPNSVTGVSATINALVVY